MFPEQLFPRPTKEFLALMAELPRHLDAAMPMRRQHRRELPGDIRHLSHLLTDERGDLRRDYLADPAALSAYLRYFLPWNIHRLGLLWSGLALDPGGDHPEGAATIVDLGTGPLTAPLTLWMTRPHLRKRPLTFVCVDRAPKPMRLGLSVLESLAEAHGGLAPWKITLVKSPLDVRLREKADLLIMANALNEVLHRGEDIDLLETAEGLAWHLSDMLTPTGSLCVVEPGIRPSAHLMAALRRGLLHHGMNPIAPCPHTGPCPMSGRGFTAWCHFNFDADCAPAWLRRLSDEAKLPKANVSLEFLYFSAKGRKLEAAPGKALVRAVSGPFELPSEEGRAFGQYGCSAHGLTLLRLPRRHLVPAPGALLEIDWPEAPERDAKSGALVAPLKGGEVPAQPPRDMTEPRPTKSSEGATRAPKLSRPAGKPADKPTGRPAAKIAPKPAEKPTGKSSARPTGEPAHKPAAKPQARLTGKPGSKPGALTVADLLTGEELSEFAGDLAEEQAGTPAEPRAPGKADKPKPRAKPHAKPGRSKPRKGGKES
jgi:hypothetical protein